MFRTTLRRCAGQATAVAAASRLSAGRVVLPAVNRGIVARPGTISRFNRVASLSRAYSDAAAASQEAAPAAAAAESPRLFSQIDDLHPNLVQAINKGMGYDSMTPVQAMTIDAALKGSDIVAQAKTGTGKTLAFLLPLLQRMLIEDPSLANRGAKRTADSRDIRGIVLSPTRELAEQIAVEARRLTANTGLVVQCAVGGTDKRRMLQQTERQGCHLLVATPGRLNDLLSDPRANIEAPNLAALVLDEADRMLDVGFEAELKSITDQLPPVSEKSRQTMLVSATIPDSVIRLARSMVRADDFQFVQTIPENESITHDNIPQNIVTVPSWTNVFPALFELIDREAAKAASDPATRPLKAIVYFNTTSLVELSNELMYQRKRNSSKPTVPNFIIQSKLTQQQRQRAADMFRQAKAGILFSTDVTARGMDFPDVTHVIQVDIPRERESYIHRLGRTGRQGKEGEGWLLVPQISLRSCKRMLQGLPIEQNTSLRAGNFDVGSGETSPELEEMKSVFGALPRGLLAATYKSMFGMSSDKQSLAEDINMTVVEGWGLQEPPAVSPKWCQNLGLARAPGMNISERPPRGDFDGGRRQSDDPFDRMSSNIRRDDPRGSGGSRGGRFLDGYNGGSRGGRGSGHRSGGGWGSDRGSNRGSDRGHGRGRGGDDFGSSW